MTQTNHDRGGRGLDVFSACGRRFKLVLHVGSHTVEVGALAQVVGVTGRNNPAGEVEVRLAVVGQAVSSAGVRVADTEHCIAAGNRSAGGNRGGPALNLARLVGGSADPLAGHFVEVLNTGVELGDVEVVVTAEGNGQAVIGILGAVTGFSRSGGINGRPGSVVRGVNSEEELGRAVSVFSADSVV